MKRRTFLLGTASIVAASHSFAGSIDYTPGLVDQLLADGKTVFIDFTTTWCTTCNAQKDVIADLKAENPAYEEHIEFVTVDYDDFRNDPLTLSMNIPRRSTLVVINAEEEIGRTIAGTSTDVIQGLMDAALESTGPHIVGTFDYTPGLVDDLLAEGKTVFVDFTTAWCTTCNAQKRVISALKSDNPVYEENIAFVSVDYDDYRNDELTQRLNIPRRSTLVVLHGDQELGRSVAGTSTSVIQGLMDTALSAATNA